MREKLHILLILIIFFLFINIISLFTDQQFKSLFEEIA